MTPRERFHAVMEFQPDACDRLPKVEWAAWWNQTVDRWREQGLPEELADSERLQRHFGLDVWSRLWVRGLGWHAPKPAYHGAGVMTDATPEEYDALRAAGGVFMDVDTQLNDDMVDRLKRLHERQEAGEILVWLTLDGFFWMPRSLLGIERHFYAFYDQPELIHRMNRDNVEHQLAVIERVCEHVQPTFACIGEDFAYNHGPMLSKPLFDAFLLPYYRQVVPELQSRGMRVFIDSDGDCTTMVPWLIEAGLDGLLPCERQAGMDLPALRGAHPRFRLIGGFDKMTMIEGEAAMRAEFDRLLPVMQSGGYIPSVDHQTPPSVPLDHYRAYTRLLDEYTRRATSADALQP